MLSCFGTIPSSLKTVNCCWYVRKEHAAYSGETCEAKIG